MRATTRSMIGAIGSSMVRMMSPDIEEVPARIDGSGHDPRLCDALQLAAAAVHADSEPDDAASAARHGWSRRTSNRARHEGPRQLRAFQLYLLNSPEPYRLEAHVRSLVKQRAMRNRSTSDLIADFHELRGREKATEGQDNANDVRHGLDWLERAAQKERDAAVEEELAAMMREFAARGVSERDVFEGRAH